MSRCVHVDGRSGAESRTGNIDPDGSAAAAETRSGFGKVSHGLKRLNQPGSHLESVSLPE